MNYREFDFRSYVLMDGLKIAAYKFMPDRRPVAIIQTWYGRKSPEVFISSGELCLKRLWGIYKRPQGSWKNQLIKNMDIWERATYF